MRVQIKARLEPSLSEDIKELRIFSFDVEKANNFKNLQDKIISMFSTLKIANFQLFYKDNQGETIAFNTDEELLVALNQIKDDVLNIKIKINDKDISSARQGAYMDTNPFSNNCFNSFPLPGFGQSFMSGHGLAGSFPMCPDGNLGSFQAGFPTQPFGWNGNSNQYQTHQQWQAHQRQPRNRPPQPWQPNNSGRW